MTLVYPIQSLAAHPARLSPAYQSSRAPSNGLDAYFVAQFSAGYITNMFGFDLRQGQHKGGNG